MALLPLLEYPDKRLRRKALAVTEFGAELHQLLDDMAETMKSANGIGLAATQVDRLLRVFIIDLTGIEGCDPIRLEAINPQITGHSGSTAFEEGCLSIPGINESIPRSSSVTVSFLDRFGKEQSLTAEGLLAVALQHEYDHLDGVLFVDRLPPLKKQWVKLKAKRITL